MSLLSTLNRNFYKNKYKIENLIEHSIATNQSNFWDNASARYFDVSTVSNSNNRLYVVEDYAGLSATVVRFKARCYFSIYWQFEQSAASYFYTHHRNVSDSLIYQRAFTQVNASYHQTSEHQGIAEVNHKLYHDAVVVPAAARNGSIQIFAVELV